MEQGFVQDYRNKRLSNYAKIQRWMEGHESVVKFGMALTMALLTGALAQITIHTPLTPVPFTMQVFGIALMGGLLGRKWGTISALMYVGLGVVGLPIFAGEMAKFHSWDLFRFAIFTKGLSSWYLVGFVAQASIVGSVVDSKAERRNQALVVLAPVAVIALILFAILDAYFLSDYKALYKTSAFPNVWFTLLSVGLVLVLAGLCYLALARPARRERIELIFGNVAGLLVLYIIGAAGFYLVWSLLGYGPLRFESLMAYAVLPFIPVDLAKILLAVGVLTLVRPTQSELAARPTEPPR
jgi:biotin transport system substrate-specific component